MPAQSLGCRFPIGWQEAPLCFPPHCSLGCKEDRSHLEPRCGQGRAHCGARFWGTCGPLGLRGEEEQGDDSETYFPRKIILT